MTKRQQAV